MKIKKYGIFIIILALIIIFSIYIKVNAVNEGAVNIISKDIIKSGDEFIVSIGVTGTQKGIMGIQGKLNYDKDIFEIKNKEIKKDKWMISAFNDENGSFMLEITDDAFYDKNYYIYNNEIIIDIILKVKDKVKTQKTNIGLTDVKFADSEFKTIEITNLENKEIEIQNNKSKMNKSNITIVIYVVLSLVILLILILSIKKIKK